ncbi:MAG: Trm112 family protein [Thermomicrobiales bacterium]|nr:Trm112 family protein [Thermomicrobiales bacterium]MCO5222768.1 Trm112 family protein [Thermomicrobiales bacterium]
MADTAQVIDPDLLALLVCPVDHAELELQGSTLVCTKCGRVYPITDGIPNMVVDG